MQIRVKTLTGWSQIITVCETDTVELVRQQVGQALPERHISVGQIQLIFRDKVVEAGQLQDHEITNGSELMVVISERQQVEVTVLYGRQRITLEMEPTETVENLKRMIYEKAGVSADEQRLLFQQREMNGGRLEHYSVCHGAVLQLEIRGIQIFVKDVKGKTHTLDVHTTDMVEHIQSLVQQKTGVTPSQQRLEFAGKQLQTGHNLQYYNIQAHSTIHMTMRLRGG